MKDLYITTKCGVARIYAARRPDTLSETYTAEIGGTWFAFGKSVDYHGIGRDGGKACLYATVATVETVQLIASPCPSYAAAVRKARRAGAYIGVMRLE